MNIETTSREFFDRMYRRDADPWQFASSDYELGRYDAIFHALAHRRYLHAFEPGCSVGVLTARLATICNRVDAIDIAPAAVELARQRCSNLANVFIAVGKLPDELPGESFDLIVFSEIGYYFEETALRAIADALVRGLLPHGVLLAAHWRGASQDHLLSGDRVHEVLRATIGLTLEHSEIREGFRLDRWTRP